jgi:enolase-phosphatase E1
MAPYTHAVITDIEGTTTDIYFVHQVLFPYSRGELRSFLSLHHQDTPVKRALKEAFQTVAEESTTPIEKKIDWQQCDVSEHLDLIAGHLEQWIDQDRKHPALKTIQGFIWQKGYFEKTFLGHVYPDVPTQLGLWKSAGIGLGIYSSGSVEAQKLLFGHTAFGDLSSLFSWFFDTAVGPKRAPESYQKIFATVGQSLLQPDPRKIIFLTDILDEALAAREAGFIPLMLDRSRTDTDIKFISRGNIRIPVVCDFVRAHSFVLSCANNP